MNVNLQSVMGTIVECFLPNFREYVGTKREKNAMSMRFDCRYSNYNDGDSLHAGAILHVIVTQDHEVFYCIRRDKIGYHIPSADEYLFASRHDSCWRSFEFVQKLYFDLTDEVKLDIAPKDCNEFLTTFTSKAFEVIRVITENENGDSYRRVLKFPATITPIGE